MRPAHALARLGAFAAVLRSLAETASSFRTLKLDTTGLTSDTRYYYRFTAPGGITSSTG